MTVTPAGRLALSMSYLRTTLAACAAFREWVGAETAAAALRRIHYEGLPAPKGDQFTPAELSRYRPYAFIYPVNFRVSRLEGPSNISGVLDVVLEQDAPEDFNSAPTSPANMLWFNTVGRIMDDMAEASDPNGTNWNSGQLAFHTVDMYDWQCSQPDEATTQGIWQRAMLAVTHGGSI